MRVILDCDTKNEIDDQFAIAYALGCPDLEVLGVVSVQNTIASGPRSVDEYVAEAARIVALCGRTDTVSCLRGADRPMETPREPVESEGLDFIIENARLGPVTILATGPATDVASLHLVAPELRENIQVVWAGGFPDEATWRKHKFGELNARADIAAWRSVYHSSLRLVMLPGWPGVVKVSVPWQEYARQLRGLRRPVTDYLATLLEQWCHDHTNSLDMDSNRQHRKVLWDVVNVAYLARPHAVTTDRRAIPTLDAAGAPDYTKPAREIDVGVDVDADLVLDHLWQVLKGL